jgi:hypothetical protein
MSLDNIISTEAIVLPSSNMFANGRQIVFADGTQKLVRDKITYEPIEPDEYYTVKIDDVITGIAYQKYKDKGVDKPSHYWWIIADANNIRNPLDLSKYIGKEIIIPNILNFKLIN